MAVLLRGTLSARMTFSEGSSRSTFNCFWGRIPYRLCSQNWKARPLNADQTSCNITNEERSSACSEQDDSNTNDQTDLLEDREASGSLSDPPSTDLLRSGLNREAISREMSAGLEKHYTRRIGTSNFFDPFNGSQPAVGADLDPLRREKNTLSYSAKLLELCDRSIMLARQSSSPSSYVDVRHDLQMATEIFTFLSEELNGVREFDFMSYETFLIRSTYAQVIRTIGALWEREGVDVCGMLLHDYLEWELELIKRGIQTADGSSSWWESRQERALRKNGSEREKDLREAWLISSGPFLQDFAPILFDVFYDLTLAPLSGKTVVWRSFASEERMQACLKLLKLVRRFPVACWDRSSSAEWHRFRNVEPDQSQSNVAVIGQCQTMFLKACLSQYRFSAAIVLWREEARTCVTKGGLEKTMLSYIARALRRARRTLRGFDKAAVNKEPGSDVGQYTTISRLKEAYFHAASLCAKYLRNESLTSGAGHMRVRDALLSSPDFQTILTCIATASTFSARPSSLLWSPRNDQVLDLAESIEDWTHQILNESLESGRPSWPAQKLDVSVCNVLLAILINLRRPVLASQMLEAMIQRPEFPRPDDGTTTFMIRNAYKLPDQHLVRASIQVAYVKLQSKKEGELEPSAFQGDHCEQSTESTLNEGPTDDLSTQFFLLLADAATRNDISRMTALLLFARLTNDFFSKATRGGGSRLFREQQSPLPAQRITFTLFPSLSIHRAKVRERRLRQALVMKQSSKEEPVHRSRLRALIERQSAGKFRMPILLNVLTIIAHQRQTGLAERFFRMLRRVESRWEMRRREEGTARLMRALRIDDRYDNWVIPIYGYQLMFDLYLYEVRYSTRMKKLVNRNVRTQSDVRLVSQLLVRGWARVGPWRLSPDRNDVRLRADRAFAARIMTMKLYEELRSSWPQGNPALASSSTTRPTALIFKTIMKVFSYPSDSAWPPGSNDFLRSVESDARALNVQRL